MLPTPHIDATETIPPILSERGTTLAVMVAGAVIGAVIAMALGLVWVAVARDGRVRRPRCRSDHQGHARPPWRAGRGAHRLPPGTSRLTPPSVEAGLGAGPQLQGFVSSS